MEAKKSKADVESSEGKMSVAPDGKEKSEDALISREEEGGEKE